MLYRLLINYLRIKFMRIILNHVANQLVKTKYMRQTGFLATIVRFIATHFLNSPRGTK
ncbi:Uncharacterised protein [Legionella donaldsonii]|uniref:Uncharacterized protein n=1 Tax=Legionella donaldsonii TaxID=45060 RepID=A0A378J3K0_9GAMM|nr:Uncharacterised protein [Legionella donaldsonii]